MHSYHSDWGIGQKFNFAHFGLSWGAKTLGLDPLNQEINTVGGVAESFLNKRGKFSDLSAFKSHDFLDLGGLDSDFSSHRGDSDFDTGISLEIQFE